MFQRSENVDLSLSIPQSNFQTNCYDMSDQVRNKLHTYRFLYYITKNNFQTFFERIEVKEFEKLTFFHTIITEK